MTGYAITKGGEMPVDSVRRNNNINNNLMSTNLKYFATYLQEQ